MDKNPLFSVVIPTKNSGSNIKKCLESVKSQDYSNIEIIIVDGFSSDQTPNIAQIFSSRIIFTNYKPLGARILGTLAANGDYIIFLDSDQFLSAGVVTECLAKFQEYDYLIIKEESTNQNSLASKIQKADRDLVNRERQLRYGPERGSLFPRAFKTSILVKSLRLIPKELWNVHVFEDAIRYIELKKISENVGFTETAIFHNEIGSLKELIIHFYEYGENYSNNLSFFRKYYPDLLKGKTKLRTNLDRSSGFIQLIGVLVSQFLKGLSFYIGYIGNKKK